MRRFRGFGRKSEHSGAQFSQLPTNETSGALCAFAAFKSARPA